MECKSFYQWQVDRESCFPFHFTDFHVWTAWNMSGLSLRLRRWSWHLLPVGTPFLTSNSIKFQDSGFWVTFERAGRRCLLNFIEQHQLLVLAHKYSFMVCNGTSSIFPFCLCWKKNPHNTTFCVDGKDLQFPAMCTFFLNYIHSLAPSGSLLAY